MTKTLGKKKYLIMLLIVGGIGMVVHYMMLPTKEEKLNFITENCKEDFRKKMSNSEAEIIEACTCITKVYSENLPDYFIDDLYTVKKTNDTIKMAELNRKMFSTPAVNRAFEKSCKPYVRALAVK